MGAKYIQSLQIEFKFVPTIPNLLFLHFISGPLDKNGTERELP